MGINILDKVNPQIKKHMEIIDSKNKTFAKKTGMETRDSWNKPFLWKTKRYTKQSSFSAYLELK